LTLRITFCQNHPVRDAKKVTNAVRDYADTSFRFVPPLADMINRVLTGCKVVFLAF